MTEKRYFERSWEEEYYIFDSQIISEKEFEEKLEYEGYTAFEDSLTGEEIIDLLNKNEQYSVDKKLYRLYRKENKETIGWFKDYEDMSYLMEWLDGEENKTGYEIYELQEVIE